MELTIQVEFKLREVVYESHKDEMPSIPYKNVLTSRQKNGWRVDEPIEYTSPINIR